MSYLMMFLSGTLFAGLKPQGMLNYLQRGFTVLHILQQNEAYCVNTTLVKFYTISITSPTQ